MSKVYSLMFDGETLPHQGLCEGVRAVISEGVEHSAGQHVAEVADAEEEG